MFNACSSCLIDDAKMTRFCKTNNLLQIINVRKISFNFEKKITLPNPNIMLDEALTLRRDTMTQGVAISMRKRCC